MCCSIACVVSTFYKVVAMHLYGESCAFSFLILTHYFLVFYIVHGAFISETFITRKKMLNLGHGKRRATLSEFWDMGPEPEQDKWGRWGEPGRCPRPPPQLGARPPWHCFFSWWCADYAHLFPAPRSAASCSVA